MSGLPEELREVILVLACTLPPKEKEQVFDFGSLEPDHPARRPKAAKWAPRAPEVPAAALDIDTTLRVMRINQHYYALGAKFLYRAPVLSRPLRLQRFLATLTQRPILGRLVQKLYIGSTSSYAEMPALYFDTGFIDHAQAFSIAPDEKRCSKEHPITPCGSILTHAIESDMAEVCAIYAGPPGTCGLDICSPGYDTAGKVIGTNEWVLRLFEARALLHWLRALAFQERREEAIRSTKMQYNATERLNMLRAASPRAAVHLEPCEGDATDMRPAYARRPGTRRDPMDWADAEDLLYALPACEDDVHMALRWEVTQSLLHQTVLPSWLLSLAAKALAHGRYLAITAAESDTPVAWTVAPFDTRVAAATCAGAHYFAPRDRFDDPCLYALSGAVQFLGGNELDDAVRHASNSTAPGMEDADAWASSHDTPFLESMVRASFNRKPMGIAFSDLRIPLYNDRAEMLPRLKVHPQLTLGAIVASVHAVLSFTPQLTSLGLSGTLERVVAGSRSPVSLPRLQEVYLGPPPPFWAYLLRFDAEDHALSSVRHVSITGCVLLAQEALALAGARGALPNLVSVSWSMLHCAFAADAAVILAAISTILTLNGPPEEFIIGSRIGVQKLRVVLHPHDYDAVVSSADPTLLNDSRLCLEAAHERSLSHHPMLDEWNTGPEILYM